MLNLFNFEKKTQVFMLTMLQRGKCVKTKTILWSYLSKLALKNLKVSRVCQAQIAQILKGYPLPI